MKNQKNNKNPIDEVIEMMLKKDAKSCKLASARLTQLEVDKKNNKKALNNLDK